MFKVLKTGWGLGVRWKDVEILKSKNGEPQISLKGKTKLIAKKKGIKNIILSISHDRKYAMATAIGERLTKGKVIENISLLKEKLLKKKRKTRE